MNLIVKVCFLAVALQIAFAEGYVAADPKAKPSSRMRSFSLFRDGLGIVLIIALLVSVIGKTKSALIQIVIVAVLVSIPH